LGRGAYWSPYYKIVLYPTQPAGYIVDVNNAGGHQAMIPWQNKEPFYKLVYNIFPGSSFKHALILGAGTGSDVDIALHNGVQSITAVEIDPTILQLGVSLRSEERRVGKERRHVWWWGQAEDGIRDDLVTGVQTCALPISLAK